MCIRSIPTELPSAQASCMLYVTQARVSIMLFCCRDLICNHIHCNILTYLAEKFEEADNSVGLDHSVVNLVQFRQNFSLCCFPCLWVESLLDALLRYCSQTFCFSFSHEPKSTEVDVVMSLSFCL